MKNFITFTVWLGMLIFFPVLCLAGGPGTTGADILGVEMGARPLGMGGAFGAVCDDPNAVSYNPAGLIQLKHPAVTGTHWIELESTTIDFLSYAQPVSRNDALAGSVIYRQVPLISNVDPSLEPVINAYDMVLSVSWATRLEAYAPGLSGGVTLKGVNSSLGVQSAFDGALDAGLLLQGLPYAAKAALILSNLGPPIKFLNQGDLLPLSLDFALSSMLADDAQKQFQVAADLYQPIDNLLKLRLGVEFSYMKFLALRGGYELDFGGGTRGLSFGLGISYAWEGTLYSVDYAYEPFYFKTSNSPTHLISLSAAF